MSRAKKHFENASVPYDVVQMSKEYFRHFCKLDRTKTLQAIADIVREIRQTSSGTLFDVKGVSNSEYTKLPSLIDKPTYFTIMEKSYSSMNYAQRRKGI